MKQKWAAKVKGFIVDYEKKTIYFPECNKITYDTGFPGIKNWINDFRSGKEISFTQLKSITVPQATHMKPIRFLMTAGFLLPLIWK